MNCRADPSIISDFEARRVLPALLRALHRDTHHVSRSAQEAATAIAGESMAPELLKILRARKRVDVPALDFFERYRHPKVLPVLVELLEVTEKRDHNECELGEILEALRFQAGRDHGKTAKEWRRGLGLQKR